MSARPLLVGKHFLSFSDSASMNVQWQGLIIGRPEPMYYLVTTFSWIDGSDSSSRLVHIDQMKSWRFYSSSERLRADIRHHVDRWTCDRS